MQTKEFGINVESGTVFDKVLDKFDEVKEVADDSLLVAAPFVAIAVRKLEQKEATDIAEKLLKFLDEVRELLIAGKEIVDIVKLIADTIKEAFN